MRGLQPKTKPADDFLPVKRRMGDEDQVGTFAGDLLVPKTAAPSVVRLCLLGLVAGLIIPFVVCGT